MDRSNPHAISGVDADARTGTCSVCGPNSRIRRMGVHNGKLYWRCHKKYRDYNNRLEQRRHRETHPVPYLKHVLSDIDIETRTAKCTVCAWTKIREHRQGKWSCRRPDPPRKSSYQRFKGDTCEWCGFVGHACQLDVDHIDENHANNEPSNLMTLCALCHRMKTWLVRKNIPQEEWTTFWAAAKAPPARLTEIETPAFM